MCHVQEFTIWILHIVFLKLSKKKKWTYKSRKNFFYWNGFQIIYYIDIMWSRVNWISTTRGELIYTTLVIIYLHFQRLWILKKNYSKLNVLVAQTQKQQKIFYVNNFNIRYDVFLPWLIKSSIMVLRFKNVGKHTVSVLT